MECEKKHCNSKNKKVQRIQEYFRALHCSIRWDILAIIGSGQKGTNTIYEELIDRGEELAKSSLYYHLSELKSAGIIMVSGYREEGRGAPEKMWRLKTTEISINLLEDLEKG